MNLLLISIIFIICCSACYAIGVHNGVKDGTEETIRRFTKYTSKQLHKLTYGGYSGRN